jgi:acyl-CoA oxidase
VHAFVVPIRDQRGRTLPGGDDGWDQEAGLLDSEYHLAMFRWREEHQISGVARRLKRGFDEGIEPTEVFSRAQDHVIAAAWAHAERMVLEAFVAKVDAMPDGDNKVAVHLLCDLFALCTIEADRGWWMEHGRLSSQRSKAITREIGDLLRKVRPLAVDLVDGFGVPAEMQAAPIVARGY